MEDTVRKQDTQLTLAKVQTILLACILVVVIVAGIFIVRSFVDIRKCVEAVEDELLVLDINSVNSAVDAFTEAANQFNNIDTEKFDETVGALQIAADNFSSIDMVKFDETVGALQAAADNFSSVDVESLNSLVKSLETVATKLQNAVNAITGIFKR